MIKLLKQTLVGTGVVLVTAVSLFIFASPVEDFLQSIFESNTTEMSTSKVKPNLRYNSVRTRQLHLVLNLRNFLSSIRLIVKFYRKDELLRLPAEVMKDDDLAAAAAEAADGRPVYCRDRFYRALAGGQYCKWDDLLN